MHATSLFTACRLAAVTLLLCSGAYTTLVLAFAKVVAPEQAAGSLIVRSDGTVVGSRLVAQAFAAPRYFWPRPSAAAYDAGHGSGSNASPANPQLTERARAAVAAFGASPHEPLPAELAAASGSGLDPHVSVAGAMFQVARVAAARQLPAARVTALVERLAFAAVGTSAADRLVNVLELNLALDAGE